MFHCGSSAEVFAEDVCQDGVKQSFWPQLKWDLQMMSHIDTQQFRVGHTYCSENKKMELQCRSDELQETCVNQDFANTLIVIDT